MPKVPAYIGDAVHEIVQAAANLWVWSNVIESKELPEWRECWIYPRHMSLGGPQQLNGKRVRVRFEIEDDVQATFGDAISKEPITTDTKGD